MILGLLLFLVCLMLYNELVRHYNHRQQVFWDDHYLAAVRSDPEDWKFGWRLEDLEQRIMSQRDALEAERKVLDKSQGTLISRLKAHTWHHQRPTEVEGRLCRCFSPCPPSLWPHPVIAAGQVDAAQVLLGHGDAPLHAGGDFSKRRLAELLFAHVENDTAVRTVACVSRPEYLLRVGPDDFRDVPSDRCQVVTAAKCQGSKAQLGVVVAKWGVAAHVGGCPAHFDATVSPLAGV